MKNGYKIETETLKISNTLNTYYGTIAKTLADKITKKKNAIQFSSYLEQPNKSTCLDLKKVYLN